MGMPALDPWWRANTTAAAPTAALTAASDVRRVASLGAHECARKPALMEHTGSRGTAQITQPAAAAEGEGAPGASRRVSLRAVPTRLRSTAKQQAPKRPRSPTGREPQEGSPWRRSGRNRAVPDFYLC